MLDEKGVRQSYPVRWADMRFESRTGRRQARSPTMPRWCSLLDGLAVCPGLKKLQHMDAALAIAVDDNVGRDGTT